MSCVHHYRLFLDDQLVICCVHSTVGRQPLIFSRPASETRQDFFFDIGTGTSSLSILYRGEVPVNWDETAFEEVVKFSPDDCTIAVFCDCHDLHQEMQRVSLFKLAVGDSRMVASNCSWKDTLHHMLFGS